MFSIKEVSELMGISAYTLRYYEKIGLLSFVRRNEVGVREFSRSDLLTLNTIERLKDTGMSLKEIKHYLDLVEKGYSSVDERLELMVAQQKKVNEQIKLLQKSLETIDFKVRYYKKAKKEATLAVCHDEREEFVQKIKQGELKKKI